MRLKRFMDSWMIKTWHCNQNYMQQLHKVREVIVQQFRATCAWAVGIKVKVSSQSAKSKMDKLAQLMFALNVASTYLVAMSFYCTMTDGCYALYVWHWRTGQCVHRPRYKRRRSTSMQWEIHILYCNISTRNEHAKASSNLEQRAMLQAADNMCEPEKWFLQYWTLAPYTEVTNEALGGVIYDFIISALKTCCIYATDEDLVFKTHRYENQQRMLLDSKNLSIAFPMICSSISLANAPAEFIRLFQTDGLVQVTRRRGVQGNVFTNGVWTVWPLFVTMIIFTGYAAILLWLSEFCGRFRQFNRGVLKGLFEGYWFAFVSATTVGTIVGKCFAMFWILCGICVTSAFTAAITTLLSSYQQAITEMAPLDDGKVGVMRGTVDKELLLQKNAYISEYDNLVTMVDGLKNGDVDSIVLDHFFYAHYRMLFRDNVYLRRHSVTQPTTVGIIFNVDSRNGLLECIRKQAFLSHLDIADDVAESVEHSSEDEAKDLFEETAHNLFGNTNLPLIIMASVLIAIVGILIVIDHIINKLSARRGQTNRLYREAATQSNFLLPITESKDIICNNRSNGVGNSISNHQLQSF